MTGLNGPFGNLTELPRCAGLATAIESVEAAFVDVPS
jgi:hypothetical protein